MIFPHKNDKGPQKNEVAALQGNFRSFSSASAPHERATEGRKESESNVGKNEGFLQLLGTIPESFVICLVNYILSIVQSQPFEELLYR